MASEDPEKASREKALLPINPDTGEREAWPKVESPERNGKN
jgi:hypothetical protein